MDNDVTATTAVEPAPAESAPAVEPAPAGGIPPAPQSEPAPAPQIQTAPVSAPTAPAEPAQADPSPNQGAVEYKPFNIPEGFDVPADSFKQLAGQLGFTQSQAQAMIDYYCRELVPAREAAVKAQIANWRQETINQVGRQGMDIMNKLVDRIGKTNPLFAPLLRDTGLCYHPTVVKAFVDLASHMQEGTGAPLNTFQTPQEKRDMASVLFPNSLR